MKTWETITKEIAAVEQLLRENEREKFRLRDCLKAARDQVGCIHAARHFYSVASSIPRQGCYECDRILAETVRGDR